MLGTKKKNSSPPFVLKLLAVIMKRKAVREPVTTPTKSAVNQSEPSRVAVGVMRRKGHVNQLDFTSDWWKTQHASVDWLE